MKRLTLLLSMLLIWLQYSLWFGKNCFYDYICIKDDIITQQEINAKLRARNDRLIIEINNLNNNQEVVEERARDELSMIQADETFYRLVPSRSKLS